MAPASPLKSLREHLLVPVDDSAGRQAYLEYAPAEHLRLLPFRFSALRLALYVLLSVCSCGILVIVTVWFPQLFTKMARAPLASKDVGEADYMLVLVHEDGVHSQWVEQKVERAAKASGSGAAPWVWFEFKKHRYVFNTEKNEFERYVAAIKEDIGDIRARIDVGLDDVAVTTKVELFGENRVNIDRPHIPMLIFVKLVHPFYLFQLFSAGIWFWEEYTIYAIVILCLSAISLGYEIYAEVSNANRLHELVLSNNEIETIRNGKTVKLHEAKLVPGDIVAISEGSVCADMLLLSGSCVADESSLTGEALPVNKEPAMGAGIVTEAIATSQYKSSYLHAGSEVTRVRETSGACKGVVLSTGFSTGKGELFRSILFPKPLKFEFERDSYRYLGVLWVIAIAAFIKRIIDGANAGMSFADTLVNSLDLITTAVPPALPLVLSSGIGFAMHRLQLGGIFCIDSQRVNSCGQLSCFCFDKTGTLTQEHLNYVGVDVPESPKRITHEIPARFKLSMATCHGLSEHDGKLQGYSLDMAMFEASGFTMEYLHDKSKGNYTAIVTAEGESKESFGIVKRFAFDAAHQRASAIVENLVTKKRYVFVKGSPEAVAAISTSTPSDLHHKTLVYSSDGYYCIGFGVRELAEGFELDINDREAVESAVEFEGLALFKNELKPESKGMLAELYVAEIDVRIITGDNALTAVHVARELDMKLKTNVAVVDVDRATGRTVFHNVDSIQTSEEMQWEPFSVSNMLDVTSRFDLALTGAALEKIKEECSSDTIQQLIRSTLIFARIRPQQKAWIVEQLIDLGHVVGMCGDGTNDCGALKAAHVGLALSSAEASIVAPFTSKAKAILDVPVLIREGRCALTTSFLGFKYMVLYPVIQLGMASVLNQYGTWADTDVELSDNQYLWDDLAIVLGLATTMLYTGASKTLTREKPAHTLFSLTIVSSVLGQIVIYVAYYAIAISMLAHEHGWYCSIPDAVAYSFENDTSVTANCAIFDNYENDPDEIDYSFEDTVTWLYIHLSYIIVAVAFNLRDPFRKPFYTNLYFTAYVIVITALSMWFLFDNTGRLDNVFQVMWMPTSFRWKLFGLFIGQFVTMVGWELIATRLLPKMQLKYADKKASEKKVASA